MSKWTGWRQIIAEEVNADNFLQQPTIRRTMCPHQNGLPNKYYKHLSGVKTRPLKKYAWEEPAFGGSPRHTAGYSQMVIQQMWHLHNIEKMVDPLQCEHILHIGAGIGSMIALLKNAGFTGRQTIVDFPEVHAVQRKYLEGVSDTDNVDFISLSEISGKEYDLMVATFSMNEMPILDRNRIENNMNNFKHFYIQHNESFDNIDNMIYFRQLIQRLPKFQVTQYDDPVYPRHPIILGTRNS